MPDLSIASTAPILTDLQNGIVRLPLAPRSGPDVVEAGKQLAQRFREAGAPVVMVNIGWAADWSLLVDGLAQPRDLRITKHQWGAFHGTDLDVQLRRRAVKTVVVGGIATNMGVESTARQAYEHGYEVVIAEDATTSLSAEMHEFSVRAILPMISRVAKVNEMALQV